MYAKRRKQKQAAIYILFMSLSLGTYILIKKKNIEMVLQKIIIIYIMNAIINVGGREFWSGEKVDYTGT
jgi:hypothetical protein